ncbi:MAG: serine/threonine protein kinase [Candidatus Xenobia bacterium]
MLAPGHLLTDNYRIVKVLGKGGMGSVYQAEALRLGKNWAIKELIPYLEDPKEYPRIVEQFFTEAQILAHLEHPGLPRVVDFFEHEGNQYLVMDLIEGETLEKISNTHGPLAEGQVLTWVYQILEILHYLHRQEPPIIFRDLKPANVMITPQQQVKLIDFGIAKQLNPETRTRTAIKGVLSPGFAPIEQFGLQPTDQRSDIYSLGATMYYLLTSRVPPVSLHRAFSGAVLEPAMTVNKTVRPAIWSVIERMMAIKIEERPRAAADVLQMFQQAENGVTVTAPASTVLPAIINAKTVPTPLSQVPSDSGLEFIYIAPGEFWMGNSEGSPGEAPRHAVRLKGYFMSRLPVTNEQFEAFLKATGYTPRAPWRKYYRDGAGPYPATNVTMYDAIAYCDWAHGRLPTEAEWERAAQGGSGTGYPWGERWDAGRCNNWAMCRDNVVATMLEVHLGRGPTPASAFPDGASACGCLDMVGNVAEWTATLYSPYPYADDGRDQQPPPPPEELGFNHIYALRGSSWNQIDPDVFRVTARAWSFPTAWSPTRGFRVCVEAD